MLETNEKFKTVIVEVPSKKGNWKELVRLQYDHFLTEKDIDKICHYLIIGPSLKQFRLLTTKGAQIINHTGDCYRFLIFAEQSDLITVCSEELETIFSVKNDNPKFLNKQFFYEFLKSHNYLKSVKIMPREKSDNWLNCAKVKFNDGATFTVGFYYATLS